MSSSPKPLCREYYNKLLKLEPKIPHPDEHIIEDKEIEALVQPDILLQPPKQISCRKGKFCTFYHPAKVNKEDTQEFDRELGHCYCGARLTTLINKRLSTEDDPLFIVVCARTYKGKNRCKKR